MNNKLLSLIAALIIIILAVWGFTAALDGGDDDKDDDKDDNTTSMVEDDDSEDDLNANLSEEPEVDSIDSSIDATSQIQALVGEKEGTASLLLSTLTFPESVMTTGADQTFTLESKGFDLAILGNESLAIEQGVYPLAQVAVEGEVMMTNGNVNLKVESLTPSFYVLSPNGSQTPLDGAIQSQIVEGLAAAGIAIPEVSPASPVLIPVEITPDADGGFMITSTSDAPFFANFNTK